MLGRDITAAIVRLLLLAGSLAFAWLLLVVSFNFPGQVPYFWLENLPPLTYPLLNVLSTFFHPDVLLHMLPLTAGMLASLIIAAAYLADLFELESVWIAFSYLLGAIFGLSYPRLRIDRSDVSSLDPSNPLKRIGGPGFTWDLRPSSRTDREGPKYMRSHPPGRIPPATSPRSRPSSSKGLNAFGTWSIFATVLRRSI